MIRVPGPAGRVTVALALLATGCAALRRDAGASFREAGAGARPAAAAPIRRPTGLLALSGEPREVPLRWRPVLRDAVTGYRVYRRDAGSPDDGRAALVEVGRVRGPLNTSFVDRGGAPDDEPGRLGDGRSYTYAVAAEGAHGVGERSDPVTATTAPPPAPPVGLEPAPPRADAIVLTWEPSRDARVVGYRVYRSPFAAGPFDPVGAAGGRFATTFADPAARGLVRLHTYHYRVSAVSVAGSEGPPSERVQARLKPPPLPPLDLAAVGGLARHVRLRWSAGHEHDVVRVVVWRAAGGDPFAPLAVLPAGRTEHTDRGLADGATYRYRLTAIDADGLESEPSAVVAATTRARPEAPRGVVAVLDGDGVRVRWQPAPPVAGVVRYRLVRVGPFGRLAPVVEVSGSSAWAKGAGKGRYAVVAIDVEGLESLPSEPARVREGPAGATGAAPK